MNYSTSDLINAATVMLKFTDEEVDAIHGFIPMTQELFNSCMDKCMDLGSSVEKTFYKLITNHSDFLEGYLDKVSWGKLLKEKF